MTLWLAIPLALLLAVIVLILASSIKFNFRFSKRGKDDRIELDVVLLFGLIKLHYELPAVVFEGFERGIRVKLEESGVTPILSGNKEQKAEIDKETVSNWMEQVKIALKAARGLKKWLRKTLSHVHISKLDWSTDFSLGDAADTAIAAGALWGLKWSIIGWISQQVKLKQNPRLFVVPIFQDHLIFSMEMACIGKLSLAYMIYAGIRLIFRVFRTKGGMGQLKKLYRRVRQNPSGNSSA